MTANQLAALVDLYRYGSVNPEDHCATFESDLKLLEKCGFVANFSMSPIAKYDITAAGRAYIGAALNLVVTEETVYKIRLMGDVSE
jgi:hypothetical protein